VEYEEALKQLVRWCQDSQGVILHLAPQEDVSFRSYETYSPAEVRRIEEQLDCILDDSYHLLLRAVGRADLFSPERYGGGIRLYGPDEVIQASRSIWEGQDGNASDRFCFIGEHRLMGDYLGFVVSRAGPRNFDVFCHEYPPEQYVEVSNELSSWRTLEGWLIHAVETLGTETL
jgi:hypothetical protein